MLRRSQEQGNRSSRPPPRIEHRTSRFSTANRLNASSLTGRADRRAREIAGIVRGQEGHDAPMSGGAAMPSGARATAFSYCLRCCGETAPSRSNTACHDGLSRTMVTQTTLTRIWSRASSLASTLLAWINPPAKVATPVWPGVATLPPSEVTNTMLPPPRWRRYGNADWTGSSLAAVFSASRRSRARSMSPNGPRTCGERASSSLPPRWRR
jgi:hypothetical protein